MPPHLNRRGAHRHPAPQYIDTGAGQPGRFTPPQTSEGADQDKRLVLVRHHIYQLLYLALGQEEGRLQSLGRQRDVGSGVRLQAVVRNGRRETLS